MNGNLIADCIHGFSAGYSSCMILCSRELVAFGRREVLYGGIDRPQ